MPIVKTSLSMVQESIGNQGMTISGIYSMLDSIFNNKLKMACPNVNAARVLYMAKGISIKDSIFKQVKFGDFQILVYDGYLGKNFRNYLYDFAIVNNQPTIYLFSDPLVNENVPTDIRINRIYNVFTFLVQMYYNLNWFYQVTTIYSTMMIYIPMVLTVRLYERVYGKEFKMNNFAAELYPSDVSVWFDDECLELIHGMDDHMLYEYGGLVEHVDTRFAEDDSE